jgi:hypothetical protein
MTSQIRVAFNATLDKVRVRILIQLIRDCFTISFNETFQTHKNLKINYQSYEKF